MMHDYPAPRCCADAPDSHKQPTGAQRWAERVAVAAMAPEPGCIRCGRGGFLLSQLCRQHFDEAQDANLERVAPGRARGDRAARVA